MLHSKLCNTFFLWITATRREDEKRMHRAAIATNRVVQAVYAHTCTRSHVIYIYFIRYIQNHTYTKSVYTRTGCSETARHLKATPISPRRSRNGISADFHTRIAEHDRHSEYRSRKRSVMHLNGSLGTTRPIRSKEFNVKSLVLFIREGCTI